MSERDPMPSPPQTDEVLDRFRRAQAVTGSMAGDGALPRGHLKIFFGMAPGVGKTYAMLAAAQRMAAHGVDVVVGVVETHGRAETEQLLLGLDILPRLKIEYRTATGGSNTLQEFDVDAAIRRRPDILLIDELAHTNAPGSPVAMAGGGRAKRWQDVEACLAAGVNVYTTLNVQHLESINDVVAQITGVKVHETVPDRVFDDADEVELVDLPPEALHERLRAGKVYLGESAERAVDPSDGFFRKGNLTALRELALRRTAAWVDSEMRRYKQDRGIRAVWPAGERIVVAVSPSPMSGRLVRAAKRMAAGLHAELFAVYVETPRAANLSLTDREQLQANLRLAESLGATTHTIAGENAASELITFARSRNVGKIVLGKTERPRWKDVVFGSFVDTLIRESGDIDVYVVRGDDAPTGTRRAASVAVDAAHSAESASRVVLAVLWTMCVVAVCSATALAFYRPSDLSEEALILLAGVVLCALWFGRVAAVCASVLAVLSFNYLFTEPRYTLNVNDAGYLVTFAVMLAVGVIVGTLAARAKEQTRRAWSRERATAAQHALSRELSVTRDARDVATTVARHAHDLLHVDVVICVVPPMVGPKRGAGGNELDMLAAAGAAGPDWFTGSGESPQRERGVARWALDHGTIAGCGTTTLPAAHGRYTPLMGSRGKVGVLGVRPDEFASLDAAQLETLDALATQAASALERVALSESEQAAQINAERERLRSALLSSVSHDLRTPLASITGAASTLEQDGSEQGGEPYAGTIDPATRAAMLRTIVEESARLNDIIANLVFATRLESGGVELRREWTTVEEAVGVGLARHRRELAERLFRVHVPSDLPMIRVDNAMLPQVVHNLIENTLRYTPQGTPAGISAWASEANIVVRVWDEGSGLADDESSKVFERFYRGRASKPASGDGPVSVPSGMGLGLTICEGIIRAHGGRIWAEPNTPRGVAFLFSLPIERPQPTVPREEARASDQAESSSSGASVPGESAP